ncbi:MAG TPA: 2-C-methyl-D-erythritol 4-phosphate cytidylyltransferase [Bacteroidales bacterium]|nr:2-C-methyl-D-erythritol 4-phosphate cytidylyltransferase [Bacteroidales bacterium]
MKLYAVIVAAGSGTRMGTDIPKQFLELAGKPVLMHTIERFLTFSNSIHIITVLPGEYLEFWDQLKKKYTFTQPHIIVRGGETRFISVRNGLEYVDDDALVAVHDAVRPLVSIGTIKRCFETAGEYGNAIPVISPSDTLRIVNEENSKPVDRLLVKQIQTPQVFHSRLLKKAYCQSYLPEFTDDATVLEKTGEKIRLVDGNRENIKITNPEDLIIAQHLLPSIS